LRVLFIRIRKYKLMEIPFYLFYVILSSAKDLNPTCKQRFFRCASEGHVFCEKTLCVFYFTYSNIINLNRSFQEYKKPSVGNPHAGFSGILCYFINFSIALAVQGDKGCYQCDAHCTQHYPMEGGHECRNLLCFGPGYTTQGFK
jgi:hypothetical protein